MDINRQKGGIIKILLIIITIIILVSFMFNFSIQNAIENEQTQENFGYIWTNITHVYITYISPAVNYIWNEIIIKIIWNNLIKDLL